MSSAVVWPFRPKADEAAFRIATHYNASLVHCATLGALRQLDRHQGGSAIPLIATEGVDIGVLVTSRADRRHQWSNLFSTANGDKDIALCILLWRKEK
eukprot:scaffold41841_cov40-Prasinocladus_malaysianus.AAC.1